MIPFGFMVGGKIGAERYLLRIARGAGGIAAFIGHNYLEYKR